MNIPRCYASHCNADLDQSELELHVFADASELAYASVAYWRILDSNGKVKLSFIAAKSRVTPLRPVSMPRLELQGALLAARLAATILAEHNLRRNKRDSKCGATPPCSPECGEAGSGGTEGEGERRARTSLAPEDNLVWVSVHTRDPQHPLFEEKFNKITKLTKVEFNCLNLVVSADSWVAVLDFFGVAGDDLPDDEPPPPEPPKNANNVASNSSSQSDASTEVGITQTEISVRSLSVVVVRGADEWCRARVSRVWVASTAAPPGAPGPGGAGPTGGTRELRGRLGALRLTDLSPRHALWRDRFRTHGDDALTFHYQRLSSAEAAAAGHECSVQVDVGACTYVHTKRMLHELYAIARDFSALRRVILQARRKVSYSTGGSGRTARRALRVRVEAPVIVLPVSPRARAALAVQLAELRLDNRFARVGDVGTVSTVPDTYTGEPEVLDVRSARLEGASLWCATAGAGAGGGAGGGRGLRVVRRGPPLLQAPAHLAFTIEHNVTQRSKAVADMTVQGTLTTLQCALDAAQYRLVRGVLAHNLGEPLDDLELPPAPQAGDQPADQVWVTSSLKLDLHDVSLRLAPAGAAALACVNFIKSRLLVETYSDLSQDIDLVSQEILVSDTRYAREPANRRGNVFSHIVQPMAEQRHSVQAEVHARKRGDSSAYTILVNNMRLMAILDWWEAVNQFIMQPPAPSADPDQARFDEAANASRQPSAPHTPGARGAAGAAGAGEAQMELKLNVTDSQLVLVEDASVWDTNAVILRSTTVITYRLSDPLKPVSCELNELEVFSCVLGLEEETALSIVDPAALHVALHADRVLHVAMGTLNLRLSYHDMRMFAAMLQSLPAQARAALSGKVVPSASEEDAPANSVHMRAGANPVLGAGAWAVYAPRWLRAPEPAPPPPPPPASSSIWPLRAIQVNAECITLCVIDDCLDSDVPLLEVSLAELKVEQDLRKEEEGLEDPLLVSTPAGPAPAPPGAPGRGRGAGGGRLAALLAADYYNRLLSGWEPVIEPWRFETTWENTLTSELSPGRVQVQLRSGDTLHANVTTALMELAQLVRANWTADYYAPQAVNTSEQSPKGSPAGHRRRSPFVPYALRNHTGHRLWFTTLLTTADELCESHAWSGPDDSWVCVRAGDTEPFSFGGRRARARLAPPPAPDAPATLHQLALRLDGWAPPDPVCVDRVGVYFRHITHAKTGATARIVLEVCLEGSARKLVTVRSALVLRNTLPHAVEVRVDYAPPTAQWSGSGVRVAQVEPGAMWAAPLAADPGALWTRPVLRAATPAAGHAPPPPPPAPAAIDWRAAPTQRALLHYECRAPPDHVYRFCCSIVRERFPAERGPAIAGHTLTLVPALRLENLLPLELHYRAAGPPAPAPPAAPAAGVAGALASGHTRSFHELNVEEGVELCVKLEGFGWSSALSVGGAGAGAAFTARLKLRDARARRLYLNARVTSTNTAGIKVSVSAAYWLVNRTGLPLVFRAEGAASEAAGQGAEHELARVVAPLLFSFASADGGPTLSARLGTGRATNPEWCSPFGLGPGVAVKRLVSRGGEGADDEREYTVGVSVRAGRGRYRHTNIVTLTPRYQLHNNSPYRLQFAQHCTATELADPGAEATHVTAVAGCWLPWHWARADKPRLLCVRVLGADGPRTHWSGPARVDAHRALHLACREIGGVAGGGSAGYLLVRAEVVSEAASLFVLLSDAAAAPPPVRIDNYAPVSIMFHQVGCSEESVVGAHGRARWALPLPEGERAVLLRAPGGTRATLQLDALHAAPQRLFYQNFIYVAIAAPHRENASKSAPESEDILVLEVPLGSTKVILGKKRYGDRSQLWRRGPNEQLIHEGSSPPQPTDALLADEQTISPHAMVLDIEEAAPRPGVAAALVVRRADVRRASTQAWRLAPAASAHARRMTCAHANLCVRPAAPQGLVPGNRVVLALPSSEARESTSAASVSWHTLRPGSGRLDVSLHAAGPTRVLRVHDTHAPECDWIEESEEDGEGSSPGARRREWGVSAALAGLALSLVSRAPPAELVHAVFAGLAADLAIGENVSLALAVRHMQFDNQLLGTPSPVLLYCLPERGGAGAAPALHASLEVVGGVQKRYNAIFFKHIVVALRPLAIRLEERLILQLWWWAAGGEEQGAAEGADEAEHEARRLQARGAALGAPRVYAGLLQLVPGQIRLSMMTASKLEGSLATLKRRLGLTLIKFEDACVELEPFVRAHAFDTAAHLARHALAHFKDELKWQAAKILGSVDFLGNPLGFVADVSEGVSGLLLEGNVGALLQNVTHGLSNSAAKVTESLGDGLERVVSDEAHEETRRRIRSGAAGAHLAAGFRGLGLGILGGMTSLVKHSYEGAAAEGLPGFLAGVGKGLLGTVTKPVIGVLDLAAETASALRDTSRRADRWLPARVRPPRCVLGAGGLLPRYCAAQAQGAALLHALNRNDYAERFLAYRLVRDRPHDIRALLSDSYLRIFTCKHGAPQVVMETHLGNLVSCSTVTVDGAHYVELGVRGGAGGAGAGAGAGEAVRRPRVQCDSRALAAWVARHAAYARQLYYERELTLLDHTDL
ncbi:vacuolar protein sorting-associated protein 13D-like [Ostrinia furnacalis]|uniref:vacuolar protein sorting-associated protein 13D-like n=1 Tax=Ostrinia furnacalis TaxID=93504 RepID=UPI00103BC295|nr:vacuolar protein sorting-associated protein 13D-like [Ostrinia furnacalis]